MEIVKFNYIRKMFGKKLILDKVTLSLNTGKVIGLLGPNGSGKTTIMKLISKLIFPTSGDIIYNKNAKIRTLIEEPTFYKSMSGIENLRYLCASNKEIKKTDIDKIVVRLKMESYINKRVGQFSMGMRQRLALAYVMLGDANLLVLDEPLNGLDPIAIMEMRDLLQDLTKSRDVCIFISSHILKELQEICTDIILVKDGSIIKECELNSNMPKYEIRFINTDNRDIALNLDKRCVKTLQDRIKIETSENEISDLIIKLSQNEVKILEVRRVDGELENIYKEVIGETNA